MLLRADTAVQVNFSWLLRVRWFMWATQSLLVVWAGVGLGVRLQVTWLVGLLVVGFVSNAGLLWRLRRGWQPADAAVLTVMLFDVALHTAVFFLSGGPFNPFTALYLVNVALGTLVLSRRRQWVQLAACLLGFASLFQLQKLAPVSWRLPDHAELMRLHLEGMLVAFVISAAFIVASMERLLDALRRRDDDLSTARQLAVRNEKLAALTTLAAGAAHELATPLGTIAVASKELARTLESKVYPSGAREDALLVREQVERCRLILSRMSASSGELAAERFTTLSVAQWVDLSLAALRDADRVKRSVEGEAMLVRGPLVAMTQALASLVRNGLQASSKSVEVRVQKVEGQVVVEIADQGPALEPHVMARLGEPFFTTRPPGQGMGLGVFLAQTLAHQLGGGLRFESTGRGTVARLALPEAGAQS